MKEYNFETFVITWWHSAPSHVMLPFQPAAGIHVRSLACSGVGWSWTNQMTLLARRCRASPDKTISGKCHAPRIVRTSHPPSPLMHFILPPNGHVVCVSLLYVYCIMYILAQTAVFPEIKSVYLAYIPNRRSAVSRRPRMRNIGTLLSNMVRTYDVHNCAMEPDVHCWAALNCRTEQKGPQQNGSCDQGGWQASGYSDGDKAASKRVGRPNFIVEFLSA